MIFALATDENTLLVFTSVTDAMTYCEGIDVEDGGWSFWDHVGRALDAEFQIPNHRDGFTVGNGSYRLVPVADKATLGDSLTSIGKIGDNPHFPTLSAVRAHLASVAQVSQHEA